MKEIYEMKGAGYSIREIAEELDIARNTVRWYLKDPEAVIPKPRRPRGAKLDPYREFVDRRLSEGLENCVVLLRELEDLGYQGGYSLVKNYVSPRRRRCQVQATVGFETDPGEQAQVDWGSFSYMDETGRRRRLWAFVMVLSWCRAIYVEFVRRADTASFIQCQVNAFDYLGGIPRRCLYDNAKVVTLGRDEEGCTEWNRRMLNFALRLGFELKLCRLCRGQTKGKVESRVKYVRCNLWPSVRFTDDAALNRQALQWCDTVANRRLHGTTHRIPVEMLVQEQPHLGKLPDRVALAPYLREDRTVVRDGYVSWEGSRYGVRWQWAGATVQVGQRLGIVEIWAGDQRLAVHPRAQSTKPKPRRDGVTGSYSSSGRSGAWGNWRLLVGLERPLTHLLSWEGARVQRARTIPACGAAAGAPHGMPDLRKLWARGRRYGALGGADHTDLCLLPGPAGGWRDSEGRYSPVAEPPAPGPMVCCG